MEPRRWRKKQVTMYHYKSSITVSKIKKIGESADENHKEDNEIHINENSTILLGILIILAKLSKK